MKKEIPICLISDEKYLFAVSTAIISALENIGENSFYKIYCLIIKDINEKEREKILSIQNKYQDKCSIELIYKKECKKNQDRVANACQYKFLLGKIFPQYEKILYLDADIVVRGDLSEFYETDISNHDLAGVFSYNHYLYSKKFMKILKIPDMKSYINAGVLLLNLNRLREKEFEDKIEYCKNNLNIHDDQHIINQICYGKIKFVKPKYNTTFTNYRHYKQGNSEIIYSKEEILEAANNPIIFHYTGAKPWEYKNLPFSDDWIKYYELTPYGKHKLIRKPIEIYNFKKWLRKKRDKIKITIHKHKINSYKLFNKYR